MRLLIVDDNPHARGSLIRLCERSDDVQVVGEAACGKTAIRAADALNPDIMFFDVELPDMSGFDLLRAAAAAGSRPLGIMVSPCADHATQAFDEGAFDYLMKPVAAERFYRAMNRARYRLKQTDVDGGLSLDASEPGRAASLAPRYLVGERQRRLYPLDPKTIDYIEADGNYVTLRAGKQEYLSRDSIKRLSIQLAEVGFVRIARSLLVNIASVLYVELAGHGTFALTLTSDVCLHSGAGYRDAILRIIPLPALSKRYRGTGS